MLINPLVDIQSRVLCLSSRTPICAVIESLQFFGRNPEPIWLHLLGYDEDSHQPSRLSAFEFLRLRAVLSAMRTPVHALAVGCLQDYEPLVLASCHPSCRHILQGAMISVGPLRLDDLPFPGAELEVPADVGTEWNITKNHLRRQLDEVLGALSLDPHLWLKERVLSAQAAVKAGLADSVIDIKELSTKKGEPENPSGDQ